MSRERERVKAAKLRREAERALTASPRSPLDLATIDPEDVQRMLHELSVHQIELEMQNEELRRAEADLASSLERYQDLYESAPVAYCTLIDGVINEANITAANLLGLSKAALTGQPLTHFIHHEDQDIYYKCRARFHETDETQACDLRMVKNDQTIFWAHLIATERRSAPPRPGGGHSTVCRVAVADMTLHRQEEEKQVKIDELLRKVQKFKTLGVLAGGMAHDFNNILATIMGNANLASMMVEPDSKVSSYMAAIEKAATRAARLTRQMVGYSGEGKYHQSEVDLNLALRESIQFLSDSIPPQVTVHLVLCDRLPFVLGDTTQVSEILVNLLTNAVEAMDPARGGRLVVRTRAESLDQAGIDHDAWILSVAPGHFATLEVEDEGSGMTPDVMEHLFEPFFSTKFTGRGLGLAELIGVVRSHGGGVQVHSEPARGSSFKIFLPAMRTPRSVHPRASPPVWRGQGRILIVDGEEAERIKVRRMAEEHGFTVIEATNGLEAVDIFRRQHGNLAMVLLDLNSPMMDGREAFQEIHRINSRIPVVVGSPYQAKEEDALVEGQAGSIRKPYRQAEFRGILQRTLA